MALKITNGKDRSGIDCSIFIRWEKKKKKLPCGWCFSIILNWIIVSLSECCNFFFSFCDLFACFSYKLLSIEKLCSPTILCRIQ